MHPYDDLCSYESFLVSRHVDSREQFVLQRHMETLPRKCRDFLELGQFRQDKVRILRRVESILYGLKVGSESGVLLRIRFDESLLVHEELPHIRVVLKGFRQKGRHRASDQIQPFFLQHFDVFLDGFIVDALLSFLVLSVAHFSPARNSPIIFHKKLPA